MRVKELFKAINTDSCPDITIIADTDSRRAKTFKYPQNGITYINEILNQFGDRTIVPHGVTAGTDEYEINYLIIEVE
jgi:hypothetical protein